MDLWLAIIIAIFESITIVDANSFNFILDCCLSSFLVFFIYLSFCIKPKEVEIVSR